MSRTQRSPSRPPCLPGRARFSLLLVLQIIVEALLALVLCTVGASWWAGSFKHIMAAPTLWTRSAANTAAACTRSSGPDGDATATG